MRLSLNFPDNWDIKEAPGNQLVAVLPGQGLPEAIVTYGPIIIRPDEQRAWMEETARADVPRGTKVKLGRSRNHETSAGWPIRLLEAEVLTAQDELVELRLCAFYLFMEHAAVAMVRAGDPARLEANSKLLLSILETGRPDWRGELLCLADLWDLESKEQQRPRMVQSLPAVRDDGAMTAALAQMDAALGAGPTAPDHLRRGGLLLDLKRPAEALVAFRAALGENPSSEPARYFAGVALGGLGRHAEAIAEWEEALKLDPSVIDTQYNIAQARFNLRDFEGALAGFKAAYARNPADFMVLRKLIQCLYALGRYEDGHAARGTFRERWAASNDPRTRIINEYVYDQFGQLETEGFRVHALETLRPRDPSFYAILTFRTVDEHDNPLPATVLLETSDQARQAGTPFVLGIVTGQQFKVVGTAKQLPAYAELKKIVTQLLGEALKKGSN